eukprot:COSAG01_NODE_9292_length_2492_cov_3.570832_2_plen_176_part_00
MIAGPTPRLSIKLAFYFSDLLNPGHGQTWVIPGSHRWPASECAARSVALRQWEPDDAAVASSLEAPPGSVAAICSGDDDAERWQGFPAQPPGAIPLAVPPNTCVLFDRRLFHASSPNISAELCVRGARRPLLHRRCSSSLWRTRRPLLTYTGSVRHRARKVVFVGTISRTMKCTC